MFWIYHIEPHGSREITVTHKSDSTATVDSKITYSTTKPVPRTGDLIHATGTFHFDEPLICNGDIAFQIAATSAPPSVIPTLPAVPLKPAYLHVVRYQPVPYGVGKKLTVQMFVDNSGDLPLTTIGGTLSVLVDSLPADYDDLKSLERSLWEKAQALVPSIRRDHTLRFPVGVTGLQFLRLQSDKELTQPEIDKLGSGSAMYLISLQKDETGRMRIKSCIHTVPTADSVLFCLDPAYNSDDTTKQVDKP